MLTRIKSYVRSQLTKIIIENIDRIDEKVVAHIVQQNSYSWSDDYIREAVVLAVAENHWAGDEIDQQVVDKLYAKFDASMDDQIIDKIAERYEQTSDRAVVDECVNNEIATRLLPDLSIDEDTIAEKVAENLCLSERDICDKVVDQIAADVDEINTDAIKQYIQDNICIEVSL
jgi:hypothetical protein